MFAKMVLSVLGGSPSVLQPCPVFYQPTLMAKVIHARLLLKWHRPRRQALLQMAVLGVAWVSLPIGVPQGWMPTSDSNLIPGLVLLLRA
jgi:hypothetical protein